MSRLLTRTRARQQQLAVAVPTVALAALAGLLIDARQNPGCCVTLPGLFLSVMIRIRS